MVRKEGIMALNPLPDSSGGWFGLLTIMGIAVTTAALKLRSWLSKDSVERKKDDAEGDFVTKLSAELDKAALRAAIQLEKANARADLEAQRADKAYGERNDMLRELSAVQKTMAGMEERMRLQSEQMQTQNAELQRLRNEVEKLRGALNGKA
jgi:hypothetical protein